VRDEGRSTVLGAPRRTRAVTVAPRLARSLRFAAATLATLAIVACASFGAASTASADQFCSQLVQPKSQCPGRQNAKHYRLRAQYTGSGSVSVCARADYFNGIYSTLRECGNRLVNIYPEGSACSTGIVGNDSPNAHTIYGDSWYNARC
jgi:hypothetical protein